LDDWPSSFSMNILYATDFHNRANTGIAFVVNELAEQTLAGLSPNGSVNLLSIGETDIAVQQGVRHQRIEPSTGPERIWRFASSYGPTCEETIKRENVSVVHIHGIWMYPQFAAARAAQRLAVPTVLTNHGHVEWALRQPGVLGAAKKRLYLTLMKDRLFQRITVQHAITGLDRDALFSFFPHHRIEIIPNFVDVQKLDRELRSADGQGGEPYVLYIGRVHHIKGVDLLIEAFSRAAIPRDWRLIVVGPTVDPRYAGRLRRLIEASPRPDRIEMRGPVWEPSEKYRLMRDAWVTVVPSHTEAISLVNLESSACFTPTITTTATGLTDWTEGGGLLIEPALSPLTQALSEAARWSDQERKQRGLASRRLIEQRYSAKAVMPRWLELYQSLH
jgi:glycosyltransferase involved in cell wall biosynthesis